MKNSLLIIDKEATTTSILKALASQMDVIHPSCIYHCEKAEKSAHQLQSKEFHLIFIDIQFLDSLKEEIKEVVCSIVFTAEGKTEEEIRAVVDKKNLKLKSPSFFIEKPFAPRKMIHFLEERLSSKNNVVSISQKPVSKTQVIGKSELIQKVISQIDKVSAHDVTVLIQGESGTGKEVVARNIHDKSFRHSKPFVAINCGAFPKALIESELFGHIKGAFTGAIDDKMGLIEAANQGTLFLDEIGELSPELQASLLRVIQEKKFRPVGGTDEKKVDIRILSATHRDINQMVQQGLFREDLLHRIRVMDIDIPPLRKRREDIPLLISHFLNKYGRQDITFSEEASKALMLYDYPGNVRELENLIQRGIVLCQKGQITQEDLFTSNSKESSTSVIPFKIPRESLDLEKILSDLEESIIEQALDKFQGHRAKTADYLGINKRSLKHRISKYKKRRKNLGN